MLMLNKDDIDRIAIAVEARLLTGFTRLEDWAKEDRRGRREWQVVRAGNGNIRVEIRTEMGHCFIGYEWNLPSAVENAFREMARYFSQTVL